MNVLILEDDPIRQKKFKHNLIGTNTVIVETAHAAILELRSNSWDYLFLDHDLGGQQLLASGPGTGYEVALWLEKNAEYQPPNIIIHSFNPVGANNIKRILPNAQLSPGCWDNILLS